MNQWELDVFDVLDTISCEFECYEEAGPGKWKPFSSYEFWNGLFELLEIDLLY